ncbi:Ribonuclease H-like domain [Cinara cedri]|uniref:Ribonuclease H-like domain n=1 Tax=Cinara cedri TaxID=506608 RepID=A0A5E4LYA0_9HEMI|nr:Ribonuclease H-like domain [Cinara cedri]
MRNVSSLFNDIIQQLKTELEKIEYVCITADCWSIFHRSYMGFTIHWLNPNTLERNSCALACRRILERHTYDNIAEIIEKVLTEFDIQSKTTIIVTDNTANFVKAFNGTTIHERLVGIVKCTSSKRINMVELILKVFNSLNLDPKKSVGNSIDGASINLFGILNGCAVFIKESQKCMDVWTNKKKNKRICYIDETRWWSKHSALSKVFGHFKNPEPSLFVELITILIEIKNNLSITADAWFKAIGHGVNMMTYYQMVLATLEELKLNARDFSSIKEAADNFVAWANNKLEIEDTEVEVSHSFPEIRKKKEHGNLPMNQLMIY